MTIGLLGTTHCEEIRRKYNYPLRLLKEVIDEFSPEVICGEVLPESWERYCNNEARGYIGDPESEYYELVFDLCREREIIFKPIDRLEVDIWSELDYFKNCSDEDRKTFEEREAGFDQAVLHTWHKGKIPFNSEEYDQIIREKYNFLENVNPIVHRVRWTSRNHIMAQRIRKAIKEHEGKNILILVGADHNYILYEELTQEFDIIYPIK